MPQTKIEIPTIVFAVIVTVLLVGSGVFMFMTDRAGATLLPAAKNIFAAIISAVVLGVGGYLKTTTPEDFDTTKFLMTVILSILIGIAMHYLGLNYDDANSTVTSFLINTGLLAALETWLKALVRRYVEEA